MRAIKQIYGNFKVEDLERPDVPEKFVEIVDGELVMMAPAGKYHNRIASNFELLFRMFCESRPDLDFGGDNDGFVLRRDPDLMYSPDACLLRRRADLDDKAWMEFSPEIAVEVLSPANNPSEIAHKCRDYLDCGSEQVWIADPRTRTVEFIFQDGRRFVAQGRETVEGKGIAEGMKIDLPAIFKK